ncbi:MAG: DUF1257 domain-containing protein [Planctomycetaceae bacterium]|nr:DUF1257 domain-containing protein [Planctomycetaceae bacterium]
MSHVVQIETEVRDPAAVEAACLRMNLPLPVMGTHRLFSTEVTGLGVQLPGWRYPAVCDLPTGQVRFDVFEGRWGDPAWLDRFLQRYSVEKATLEARKRGHAVTEQLLSDGSIRLTVQVAG